jgi:hypothetical protein
MTERTDDWRTIFKDLTDNSGCYEIDKVNIYQLTSHLEELYLKIRELETQLKDVQEVVRTHENVRNIGL